jgi:hypothetical protein
MARATSKGGGVIPVEGTSAPWLYTTFRDLAVLQPPIVYPVAADRLGLVRLARAADVVEFYATIERVNLSVRAMSNEPPEKVSLSTCSRSSLSKGLWCKRCRPSNSEAWKSALVTRRALHSKSLKRFCF